jgi:hypothetical protein
MNFHLFVNPVVIGSGMYIFGEVKDKINLTLQAAVPFSCGITLMRYGLTKSKADH